MMKKQMSKGRNQNFQKDPRNGIANSEIKIHNA